MAFVLSAMLSVYRSCHRHSASLWPLLSWCVHVRKYTQHFAKNEEDYREKKCLVFLNRWLNAVCVMSFYFQYFKWVVNIIILLYITSSISNSHLQCCPPCQSGHPLAHSFLYASSRQTGHPLAQCFLHVSSRQSGDPRAHCFSICQSSRPSNWKL